MFSYYFLSSLLLLHKCWIVLFTAHLWHRQDNKGAESIISRFSGLKRRQTRFGVIKACEARSNTAKVNPASVFTLSRNIRANGHPMKLKTKQKRRGNNLFIKRSRSLPCGIHSICETQDPKQYYPIVISNDNMCFQKIEM